MAKLGFSDGSSDRESACNAGDLGAIPVSGRSPGGGNDNPLQCPGLENPMDRGAWQAMAHRVAKSRTRLSSQAWLNWSGYCPQTDEVGCFLTFWVERGGFSWS